MQGQRVFRITVSAVAGLSAAAAAGAGFGELAPLWRILCLVMAACLAAGGVFLTAEPPGLASKKILSKLLLSRGSIATSPKPLSFPRLPDTFDVDGAVW